MYDCIFKLPSVPNCRLSPWLDGNQFIKTKNSLFRDTNNSGIPIPQTSTEDIQLGSVGPDKR
ncbi:hypothetical protein J6590_001549 [Homalodisca vitripennis]|nr:hypothetical protein J6590_001549 [Homalodisca vitripennis]